jgi:hypothetical protein
MSKSVFAVVRNDSRIISSLYPVIFTFNKRMYMAISDEEKQGFIDMFIPEERTISEYMRGEITKQELATKLKHLYIISHDGHKPDVVELHEYFTTWLSTRVEYPWDVAAELVQLI